MEKISKPYWDKVRQFAYLESGSIWRCKSCGRKVREINILSHVKKCFPMQSGEFVYVRKREEIDLINVSHKDHQRFYGHAGKEEG